MITATQAHDRAHAWHTKLEAKQAEVGDPLASRFLFEVDRTRGHNRVVTMNLARSGIQPLPSSADVERAVGILERHGIEILPGPLKNGVLVGFF